MIVLFDKNITLIKYKIILSFKINIRLTDLETKILKGYLWF